MLKAVVKRSGVLPKRDLITSLGASKGKVCIRATVDPSDRRLTPSLGAGGVLIHPTQKEASTDRYRELGPVVQRLDNAIEQINHYPVDKC